MTVRGIIKSLKALENTDVGQWKSPRSCVIVSRATCLESGQRAYMRTEGECVSQNAIVKPNLKTCLFSL